MKYIGDNFLLVYLILQPHGLIVSGCLLNLAKEAFQECIVFLDGGIYILEYGDFIILCIMLAAPRFVLVLCCINGTSMRT